MSNKCFLVLYSNVKIIFLEKGTNKHSFYISSEFCFFFSRTLRTLLCCFFICLVWFCSALVLVTAASPVPGTPVCWGLFPSWWCQCFQLQSSGQGQWDQTGNRWLWSSRLSASDWPSGWMSVEGDLSWTAPGTTDRPPGLTGWYELDVIKIDWSEATWSLKIPWKLWNVLLLSN